jgi:exonuclease VII small subunit
MSELNNKTVQSKTEELSQLVAWFDSENFEIEQALEKYKEAEDLAAQIEHDLISLKNNIQVIKQKFDSEQ